MEVPMELEDEPLWLRHRVVRLRAALERLTASFAEQTGISVDFQTALPEQLRSPVRAARGKEHDGANLQSRRRKPVVPAPQVDFAVDEHALDARSLGVQPSAVAR